MDGLQHSACEWTLRVVVRVNHRGAELFLVPGWATSWSANRQILVTRVGLKLSADLTFEHWEQAGPKLFRIADLSAWRLGDWLVFGEYQYKDRYRRAIEVAGIDYKTLRNYACVRDDSSCHADAAN